MDNKIILYKAIFADAKELKAQLEELKNSLQNLEPLFYQGTLLALISMLDDDDLVKPLSQRVKLTNLIADIQRKLTAYNELRDRVNNLSDIFSYNIPSVTIDTKIAEVKANIDNAIRGCSIIMSICENLIKPQVSPESLDRLNQLRTEVEKIEIYLPDDKQFLTKNITEAIEEYEQGHLLASALIAARVIMYVYEQIPIEDDSKQQSSDMTEQKLKTLIKRGIIDEKERDAKKEFISSSKMARNTLSHRADVFPLIDEALSLVASAVTFCRYYKDLLGIKESNIPL
jgi:hypothetical protein